MEFRGDSKRNYRGSTASEFLLVFPVFVLASLFVLEASLIWTDRHIVDLASFEAGRILVSAPVEYDSQGNIISDPCKRPQALSKATSTAIKRVSIISPPVVYELSPLIGINNVAIRRLKYIDSRMKGLLPDHYRRLLLRTPSSKFATNLECHFDQERQSVRVTIIYARPFKIPFVQATLARSESALDVFRSSSIRTETISSSPPVSFDIGVDYQHLLDLINQISVPLFTDVQIRARLRRGRLPLKSVNTLPITWHEKEQSFDDDLNLLPRKGWSGNIRAIARLSGNYRMWAHKLSIPSRYIKGEKSND